MSRRKKKGPNRHMRNPSTDTIQASASATHTPSAPTTIAVPKEGGKLVDVRPGEIDLKSHVEAYESARTSAHRIVLITCFVSLALLGIARTPGIKISKFEQWGVAIERQRGSALDSVREELFPPGSYAVVLGLFLIPVLVHWSYATLSAALGLRCSLLDPSDRALGRAEGERLRAPLVGSPFIRRDSPVARWAGMATVLVAGLLPLVCDGFLLGDYTLHFEFAQPAEAAPINVPVALWFAFPGTQGLKPTSFFGVQSNLHPVLLPPLQSWFCLVLFAASCVLTWSSYRRIFSRA
jgi:hypothetical protein